MSSQAVDVQTDLNADVEGLSVECLARRIAHEMWDYTGGLPGRWVPLMIIQERLALEDETAAINAVQFAVERQWLEEFGGHNSIRLTNVGRSIDAIDP
jgi:hypothetical protein